MLSGRRSKQWRTFIRNDRAAGALLDVFYLQVDELGAAQSAAEQQSRNRPPLRSARESSPC